jgi:hypothetical protein
MGRPTVGVLLVVLMVSPLFSGDKITIKGSDTG